MRFANKMYQSVRKSSRKKNGAIAIKDLCKNKSEGDRQTMLVIGKKIELGSDNLPVRGQCEPHTKGWRLRWFSRGKEEVLYESSYYFCTELLAKCAGIPEGQVRAKITALIREMSEGLEETQRLPTLGADAEATVKIKTLPRKREPAEASETTVIPRVGLDQGRTEVMPKEEMDEHLRNSQADTPEL